MCLNNFIKASNLQKSLSKKQENITSFRNHSFDQHEFSISSIKIRVANIATLETHSDFSFKF